METQRTRAPTEREHAFRPFKSMDILQLNVRNYSSAFVFFENIQKQRVLDRKQPSQSFSTQRLPLYNLRLDCKLQVVFNATLESCMLSQESMHHWK